MERNHFDQARKLSSYDYLCKALFRLAASKRIRSISVKELCADAHLNRSTFYASFSSMDDFLNTVMRDVAGGLVQVVTDYGKNENLLLRKGAAYECYRDWFKYVDDNRDAFEALTGHNGLPEFRTLLDSQGIEWYGKLLRPLLPKFESRISLEALAIYIVSAHQGLMMWYLGNGQRYSADYMARQLNLLTFEGSFSLLNLFCE